MVLLTINSKYGQRHTEFACLDIGKSGGELDCNRGQKMALDNKKCRTRRNNNDTEDQRKICFSITFVWIRI